MRKINSRNFSVATRNTTRDVNRQIALNLIREMQPISRADLARSMNLRRGVVSVLVDSLITDKLIYEGTTGSALRGRKPVLLHTRTHDRIVAAVDIRFDQTYILLCDFAGNQIALETFETVQSPAEFAEITARNIRGLLKKYRSRGKCEGVGVVVPGVVDALKGCVRFAPRLGWHDVELCEPLEAALGLPVKIENEANACALGHLWLRGRTADNFMHVSVSEGVGVGVVINGELLRGHDNLTGEFGHMPISDNGPVCACGARGCWEVYTSNRATLARYLGKDLSVKGGDDALHTQIGSATITDVIRLARAGDEKARRALEETARYLGLGLTTLIYGLNPSLIFFGGEITGAWDLIEPVIRQTLAERALISNVRQTPIQIVPPFEHPRLRGATALVAAPNYAAPRLA